MAEVEAELAPAIAQGMAIGIMNQQPHRACVWLVSVVRPVSDELFGKASVTEAPADKGHEAKYATRFELLWRRELRE